MILSIVLVVWLTGKVFKHGVMRTGQPPKVLEILRLMRGKG